MSSPKKYKLEKIWFLDKNHGLSPSENVNVLHFLKVQFSGLKNHSFLSIRSKIIFTNFVSPKKKKGEKVWFLDKNHGLSPLENLAVLHFLKLYIAGLKIVLFYPEYQKTIFSDLICPKNTNRKYFDFWPKKWIISLEKTIFVDLLKL